MPVLFQTIFICIIASLSVITAAAPTINLQSNKASYTVGDQVILVVTLSDSPLIYGGGLDLTFNPAVVNASSVLVNPLWDFTIKEGIIDNTTGDINDIFFTHFSGLSGNMPVAIITLDTIASGSADITIAESPVKQFTDTDGEIVAFGTNNLANNLLVNTASVEDPEQAEEENTTNEQADIDQTESEQTTTETTSSGIFVPTDAPSDLKEQPYTTGIDGQDYRSSLNDQKGSGAFIASTKQVYTKTSSYNNEENPSTSRPGADSEDNHGEKPLDRSTQESLSSDKNSYPDIGEKKTEWIPILLITLIFIISAFLVYKIITYNKKRLG